jgi:uncharacterized protein involved in exopolysaccharide biosynthesis
VTTPTTPQRDGEISLLGLAAVLLRWRGRIVIFALVGGLLGLTQGLLSTRVYQSTATFIPQGSEGPASGLAAAVGQLGIRIPSGGGWGPATYVELFHSRALLAPLVLDTVVVAEQGGKRVAVMDLLGSTSGPLASRVDETIQALGTLVSADEVKSLGAVSVAVTTPWPSVSYALADKLVRGVNQFNLATRKAQSTPEREFIDERVAEAEKNLQGSEERLKDFLQRNRVSTSPELVLERDRLQRDVQLKMALYTSLLQSREEARIKEIRDTPVITVIEPPRIPVVGQPRGTISKAVLGAFAGGVLAVFLALLSHAIARARRTPDEDAQEFFRIVDEARPKFLRRQERAAR